MQQKEDAATRFHRQADERHLAEVVAGMHDDECEWGIREHNGRQVYNMICHCSKRQRERDGYTTPPDELHYNPPSCPRCWNDVQHDGDSFTCRPCKVVWPDPYGPAEFTDDYGDLSR